MFRSALRRNLLSLCYTFGLWTFSSATPTRTSPPNDICVVPDQWRVPVANQTIVDEVYFPPNYPIIHNAEEEIKNLKYKHDFASADAGARVLASAPGIKGVKAIQRSSHETYMMSECDEPVWVVLALPERLSVELVAFETSESFSSYFRKIAILGSAAYPTKQWRLLAVVELDPARIQNVFNLRHVCAEFAGGSCWVSHIKFQVLSYMPNDSSDVCTLSRFSLYGSTVMQGLETKMKKPGQKTNIKKNREPIIPASVPVTPYKSPPMSFPVEHSFNTKLSRELGEESMCMQPLEVQTDENDTFNSHVLFIDQLLVKIQESDIVINDYFAADNPVGAKDVILIDTTSRPASQKIRGSSQVIQTQPLLTDTPLTALLEKIIADSLILEQKTRLSSSIQSVDEVPPIITLVDRLNDIQKVLSVHMNKTTATTLIVKNLVAWLSMMNADLDLMRDSFRSQLDQLVRASSVLQIPEFMKHLTLRICSDSFTTYSLIESSQLRSHRRSICVLSAIYSLDMRSSAHAPIITTRPNTPSYETDAFPTDRPHISSREPSEEDVGEAHSHRLERIQLLLAFTDSGRAIGQWRFSYVLNLYLEKLRHRFGSASEYDSVYESNAVYKSAQLYLDSLAALYWPSTFLHIFPLPSWSSTQIFFKHPIVIYWAVVAFEMLQVFGRMFYTIGSALIYAFVVGNAYIFVQARNAQEFSTDLEDEEDYGTEDSPTSPCRRFFAADYQSGDQRSSHSVGRSTPNSSSLRQHYDQLLHTLGRVRQSDKKIGYRRLKSK